MGHRRRRKHHSNRSRRILRHRRRRKHHSNRSGRILGYRRRRHRRRSHRSARIGIVARWNLWKGHPRRCLVDRRSHRCSIGIWCPLQRRRQPYSIISFLHHPPGCTVCSTGVVTEIIGLTGAAADVLEGSNVVDVFIAEGDFLGILGIFLISSLACLISSPIDHRLLFQQRTGTIVLQNGDLRHFGMRFQPVDRELLTHQPEGLLLS